MVPVAQLRTEIDERLALGQEILDRVVAHTPESLKDLRERFYTWDEFNEALMRRSFDVQGPGDEYKGFPGAVFVGFAPVPIADQFAEFYRDVQNKMRRLKSQQERLGLYLDHPNIQRSSAAVALPVALGTDVFIVHGHDGETKQTVARFLNKLLAQEPVILHEQADRGRTIIEKFEDHSSTAAVAVSLLTADDTGGPAGGPLNPRARQNVVLETGFFLGKLGRGRVLIIHEAGVELPSDLHGVLYIPLDKSGAWKALVARELEPLGLQLDLSALLK